MTAHISRKLAGLQLDDFEKRTHFGKLGRKIKIMTNFFEITNLPSICIYQYVPPFSFLLYLLSFVLMRLLIERADSMSISLPMFPPFLTGM